MKKSIFIILSCLILNAPVFSGNDWKYEKTRKSIDIYSKKYENSKIKMFKGVTIIDSGVEILYEILRRPSAYVKFLYRCKESKLIKRFSEYEVLTYNVTKMPWPVKDREVLVRSSLKKDLKKGVFILTIKNILLNEHEKYITLNKKFKLMQKVISIFKLEIIDRNTTKITFNVFADPGGLPSTLVNIDSINTPYKSLINLKKIAKEKVYIEAAKKAKKIPGLEKYFRKQKKLKLK